MLDGEDPEVFALWILIDVKSSDDFRKIIDQYGFGMVAVEVKKDDKGKPVYATPKHAMGQNYPLSPLVFMEILKKLPSLKFFIIKQRIGDYVFIPFYMWHMVINFGKDRKMSFKAAWNVFPPELLMVRTGVMGSGVRNISMGTVELNTYNFHLNQHRLPEHYMIKTCVFYTILFYFGHWESLSDHQRNIVWPPLVRFFLDCEETKQVCSVISWSDFVKLEYVHEWSVCSRCKKEVYLIGGCKASQDVLTYGGIYYCWNCLKHGGGKLPANTKAVRFVEVFPFSLKELVRKINYK